MKNKKAFTLVELIVIMIIVTILGLISFFYVHDYISDSRDEKRKDYLNKIFRVLENYYLENDEYPIPDNINNYSAQNGLIKGEIGKGVISKIENLGYDKDPIENTNYKYFLLATRDRFKLEANLENGEKYEVGNINKNNIFLNKKTGYIFKYSGNRWQNEDSNCKLPDVEVWSYTGKLVQVWAPCNSTLGNGLDWKKVDWTGKRGKCGNYNGSSLTDEECTKYDSFMVHNKSAKEYFDKVHINGVNEYGDSEFDNIWGKGYSFKEAFDACPKGWRLPSEKDWIFLLENIGAIKKGTVSNFDITVGIITRKPLKGRGWKGHSLVKSPEGNLANLLKIPLSSFLYNIPKGNDTFLRASDNGSNGVYLSFEEAGILLLNNRDAKHPYPVRCLKNL